MDGFPRVFIHLAKSFIKTEACLNPRRYSINASEGDYIGYVCVYNHAQNEHLLIDKRFLTGLVMTINGNLLGWSIILAISIGIGIQKYNTSYM